MLQTQSQMVLFNCPFHTPSYDVFTWWGGTFSPIPPSLRGCSLFTLAKETKGSQIFFEIQKLALFTPTAAAHEEHVLLPQRN